MVSTFAYPLFLGTQGLYGGAEVQMALLAKELGKHHKEHEIHMLIADVGQKKHLVVDNVHLHTSFTLNKSLWNYLKAPFSLYNKLKQVDPDIVIQRAYGAETLICGWYAKRNNKKFIYAVAHDNDYKGWPGLHGFLFKLGFKYADKYIVQSVEQERALKPKNTELIKKGIALGTPAKGKSFLWVGRSVEWKQPMQFLDTAAALPDQHFTMVCQRSNDLLLFNLLKERAATLNNVQFFENVAYPELEHIYTQARALILTSKKEGDLPMICLEAMSHSVPIISTGCNPDQVFDKNDFGIVEPGMKGMINLLRNMCNDDKLHANMAKAAKDYVQKTYAMKDCADAWSRVISNITS